MTVLPTIKVLDIPVNPLTMKETVAYLAERTALGIKTFVVTANTEILMMGYKNKCYKELLYSADIVLPDGAGTVWAGRTLGNVVPERVAGYDLFLAMLKESSAKSFKLFFFGSAPQVAEKAKEKALQLYPQLQIVGCRNGYFAEADETEIVQEINDSGAQILFVALGAPKQEYWIKKHAQELIPALHVGLGGSFDVLAGKMERAPKWMQDASLEWLFRLYKQPQRFLRMLSLPHFVLLVWREKYMGKK